ncbi:hypothetical protein RB195_005378 [Necator americanus]|uniref:Uncharacterized protein n=1 Tax=Necator americanus TaxID=51031 RepID=A0ABR1BQP7_NECAM
MLNKKWRSIHNSRRKSSNNTNVPSAPVDRCSKRTQLLLRVHVWHVFFRIESFNHCQPTLAAAQRFAGDVSRASALFACVIFLLEGEKHIPHDDDALSNAKTIKKLEPVL